MQDILLLGGLIAIICYLRNTAKVTEYFLDSEDDITIAETLLESEDDY